MSLVTEAGWSLYGSVGTRRVGGIDGNYVGLFTCRSGGIAGKPDFLFGRVAGFQLVYVDDPRLRLRTALHFVVHGAELPNH